jgi:hypothetical protein
LSIFKSSKRLFSFLHPVKQSSIQTLTLLNSTSKYSIVVDRVPQESVITNFLFLTRSTITSFFTSNLIDIPISLKTSSSLFYKAFELPLLRFTNYLMRGGLRGPSLKSFTQSMFWFSKTWLDLHTSSVQQFTFLNLYHFLNYTTSLKQNSSQARLNPTGTVLVGGHLWGANTILPQTNFSFKNLLLKELMKFNPLFNFYIEKVDKTIRKNSRNKTDKLKLIWKFVPIYKRLYVTMTWLLKDLKFQKSKRFSIRLLKVLELIFTNPQLSFISKLKNFIHFYVFKNFKQTLLQTLQSTFK